MSTTPRDDVVKACEYRGCEEEKPRHELIGKEFCCHEHKIKDIGDGMLRRLKYDHRYCNGCFTKLKTVQRPTDEQLRHVDGKHSTESIIGFQFPTEHADVGEKTFNARDDRKEIIGTGIVCGNCGQADNQDDFQRDLSPVRAAKRLHQRVVETREEGQHDMSFNGEAFVKAWNESHDWEYSLGVALEQP